MSFPERYEPQNLETKWCRRWLDEGIYAYDPNRTREETFVVDTPPPTVSGSLHVGHMFSYSHQDFIVRFQRMRGKNIFFPIGWDDNGLPTERRVQNLFNVRCEPSLPFDPTLRVERQRKGDPIPISRENFIRLCAEVTREDEEAFRHLWTRLGLSYDWTQEYATIDTHCRRISQWSFLDLFERGEIYALEQPVLWDVDFQTAIAQAEVEDRERPSAYHFLRFTILGADEYIVIATTRPELLPACVAVLVHPEDERYRRYIGKYAVTPLFHVPVPIMADPKADPEKGTGIVMVCTFGDQTDVEWWKQYRLPLRQIVGRDGHLLEVEFYADDSGAGKQTASSLQILEDGAEFILPLGATRRIPSLQPTVAQSNYREIVGKYVKQAQKILVSLAEKTPGVLDRPSQEISHAVKFFEKGERPLELIPTRQWYTRLLDKKEALLEQGRKIQWHPSYMLKRYEHWVEGLNQDWCLSRQRYFGVPIPVWYPIDTNGRVLHHQPILPSRERLPIDPLSDVPDGYTPDQRNQPNGFTGDPDVLDTWATSSLTPQIATHWVLNPERHRKLFPMDIRPQSHEIIRTWAFYTIVKAYLHEQTIPWKHVVISGWILDPDRKKMSKSQGNVVTPEPLIDQYGADSVRYWAARARLGVDTAYDEQIFSVGKRLCTKLFNASRFVLGRFADIDRKQLTAVAVTVETDRLLVQELRPVVEKAARAFESFDYAQALMITEDFFWRDFCDNYLELAKPRTYEDGLTAGRLSACAALRLIHRAILRMFAPFLPYLTEEIWSHEYAQDSDMHSSIHRSPYPTLEEFAVVPPPTHAETYSTLTQIIDAVRKAKADANVSMAKPVAQARISATPSVLKSVESVLEDVRRMLHIENLVLDPVADAGATVSVQVQIA